MNQITKIAERGKSLAVAAPPQGRDVFKVQHLSRFSFEERTGLILIVFLFGIVGAWLALTPLAAAIIATGVVGVEGKRQTVQHLDGGTVTEILVREGQQVEHGQVLLRLNDTAAAADVSAAQLQMDAQRVTLARLVAERDEADTIKFPADLIARVEQQQTLREMVESETRLFENRRQAYTHAADMYRGRILQTQDQIRGAEAVHNALTARAKITDEEAGMVRQLFRVGATPRTRLLDAEKASIELQGQISSTQAQIAQLKNSISENELAILKLRQEREQQVNDSLKTAFRELGELRLKFRTLSDILDRTVVRAPATGSVVGLTVFTIGQVVNRGEKLMDIVPSDAQLIIDAVVRPEDVDELKVGMDARIRLIAMKTEDMPIVTGKVTRVAADRIVEQQSQVAVFPIEVRFNHAPNEMPGWLTKRLYAGMPVELQITTRNRSALSYIVEPLVRRFEKAFVQQ